VDLGDPCLAIYQLVNRVAFFTTVMGGRLGSVQGLKKTQQLAAFIRSEEHGPLESHQRQNRPRRPRQGAKLDPQCHGFGRVCTLRVGAFSKLLDASLSNAGPMAVYAGVVAAASWLGATLLSMVITLTRTPQYRLT